MKLLLLHSANKMLIGGQKKNHDTHCPANSPTANNEVMDTDDEAAG
jgi:hypothetical protein